MKMQLKALLLCFLLINATPLKAEWDPICVMLDQDINSEELLKAKHFKTLKRALFDEISNSWCSKEKANMILELVVLTKPTVCVEIGVFTGSTLLPIAAGLKYINKGFVSGIDAWSPEVAVKYLPVEEPNAKWWSTVNMHSVKKRAISMIQKWDLSNHCALVHSSSEEAAANFDSIDFLHLDGDFSEEGSLRDLQLYLPKVKSGGYILLSNVYIAINGCLTKIPSLYALIDECEMICDIDNGNTMLFRKG